MAAAAPNQRASLLSGLRTGGVRSTSVNVPHTAAPGATFNTTRHASSNYNNNYYPQEDEEQELADMVAHKMYFNNGAQPRMQAPPMTAAVDGSFNRFSQQQMRGGQYMNGGMNAMHAQAQAQQQQQQALQMQMMQLEMLRLQTMQAQQYQAELMQAQLQQQQHQQQPTRNYNPPATAGPVATSFGSSQLRRPSQVDSLRHQLGLAHEEQVPQTAALGGKFGGRLVIPADNEFPGSRNAYNQQTGTPMTPTSYASTNVISGGTSLGSAAGGQAATPTVMSKSDSATNWRRAATNTSVLRRSPPPAMPDVKVTPPPIDTTAAPASGPQSAFSPAGATPTARARPTPLRFTPPAAMAGAVAVSAEDGHDSEDTGSDRSSNKSGGSPRDDSSPATPQSLGSFAPPLSPREAAAQKLYEGLGLGRPEKAPQPAPVRAAASVPARQPRGPPSGADELGPRNFAQRIRKHAIGGLGALIESRSRSTTPTPVEAY